MKHLTPDQVEKALAELEHWDPEIRLEAEIRLLRDGAS